MTDVAANLVLPAPLWRRLVSALYDALLLAALWMTATLLGSMALTLANLAYSPGLFRGWLFLVGLAYFGLCWTRGGQTLGMRVWRLKARRVDGGPLSWPDAAARYALAWIAWLPLGLGVLWCVIDARKRAWNDIGSRTELVLIPPRPR